eukprot:TRINITY_DN16105_c0_g1_i1.p1 TRINITY_DN16105_c0_g1~~TRINITY_DN16105_c0_g1_i1.p1  ORF type:complete len:667 (+),score=-143.21 TRINITY_DN16105_c0_g1_i1:166-2001(+)
MDPKGQEASDIADKLFSELEKGNVNSSTNFDNRESRLLASLYEKYTEIVESSLLSTAELKKFKKVISSVYWAIRETAGPIYEMVELDAMPTKKIYSMDKIIAKFRETDLPSHSEIIPKLLELRKQYPYVTYSMMQRGKLLEQTDKNYQDFMSTVESIEPYPIARKERKEQKKRIERLALAVSIIVGLGEGLVGLAFTLSVGFALPLVLVMGTAAAISNFFLFRSACVDILKDLYFGTVLKNKDGSELSKAAKLFTSTMLIFCLGAAGSLGFLALSSGIAAFSLFVTNPIAVYALAGVVAAVTTVALFSLFAHIVLGWMRNGAFNGLSDWYAQYRKNFSESQVLSFLQTAQFLLRMPFQGLYDAMGAAFSHIKQAIREAKHAKDYDSLSLAGRTGFWALCAFQAIRRLLCYGTAISAAVLVNIATTGIFFGQFVQLVSHWGMALSSAKSLAYSIVVAAGSPLNIVFYTKGSAAFSKILWYPEKIYAYLQNTLTSILSAVSAGNSVFCWHQISSFFSVMAGTALVGLNAGTQFLGGYSPAAVTALSSVGLPAAQTLTPVIGGAMAGGSFGPSIGEMYGSVWAQGCTQNRAHEQKKKERLDAPTEGGRVALLTG